MHGKLSILLTLYLFLGSSDMSTLEQVLKLQEQFNYVADETCEKICASGMSINRFKARLESLRIQHKNKRTFSWRINEEFTLDKIVASLSQHWNFLNFTLLETLICRLGYAHLKKEMKDYMKSLRSFQHHTRLSDFARCYSTVRKEEASRDMDDLVIQLGVNWETSTLEDIDELRSHMVDRFDLPSFSMTLKELSAESSLITWSLPSELASHMKNQLKNPGMVAFYKENSILSISIDGVEYSCSASSDDNGQSDFYYVRYYSSS